MDKLLFFYAAIVFEKCYIPVNSCLPKKKKKSVHRAKVPGSRKCLF